MKWATGELDLMENEAQLANFLFESEYRGISIDPRFLMVKSVELIREQLKLRGKIAEVAAACGLVEFNPGSPQQVKKFYEGQCEFTPLAWGKPDKKGQVNSSWGKDALEQMNLIEHGATKFGAAPVELAKLIMELNSVDTNKSSFCDGWLGNVDDNDIIHANFKQHGTKTSRLSCTEPNAQNFPPWVLEAMLIPKGYVGVKWDKSQIEYRMFAHYANNPAINAIYAKDPASDFHQLRADMLGFPRKPIKPINFGIIYGMGEAKTKRSIFGVMSEIDSPKFRKSMARYSGGIVVPEYGTAIEQKLGVAVASNVLKEYHATMPEIKELFRSCKEALQSRGWVKNFFGRRYFIPVSKSYIGLNAIIQGGAADLFKQVLVELHMVRCKYALSVCNIHDCDMSIMKIEDAQNYVNEVKDIVASAPFIIPVLVDFEVALGRWSTLTKVKDAKDIKATFTKLDHVLNRLVPRNYKKEYSSDLTA